MKKSSQSQGNSEKVFLGGLLFVPTQDYSWVRVAVAAPEVDVRYAFDVTLRTPEIGVPSDEPCSDDFVGGGGCRGAAPSMPFVSGRIEHLLDNPQNHDHSFLYYSHFRGKAILEL